MRRSIFLAILPLLLSGCGMTRIVTVSPDNSYYNTYSTTVSARGTNAFTTTRVIAADRDISLSLDLQAVGAAFAQSSTVEEFETLLNNSSYMISNLDLNGDGYIDYLRVLETVDRNAHVFLIQAVLAPNVYQDVATLVAEIPSYGTPCVQIIGSTYIYGPNYIIQPVYYTRPLIFTHLVRPAYVPWHSPWYWDHFPPCYRRPAPLYISHYQAYVRTYIQNHAYCHRFDYAPVCHYPDYDRVCRPNQRNDYGEKYPERSFTVRNANIPNRVVNAKDIREIQEAKTVTRSASAPSSISSRSSVSGSVPGSSSVTVPSPSGQPSGARSSSGTSTVRQSSGARSSSSSTSTGRTTVRSTVNNSGTATTRTTTVSPSGQKSTTVRGSNSSSGTTARSSSSSSRNAEGAARSSSSGTRSTGGSVSRSGGTSTGRNSASGQTRR